MCDRPRVLVADCEPVIADTLAIILNCNGYDARPASTQGRAMELLRVFQPHMMFSCLKLGGVNFPMHVADRFPDCKIVISTGYLRAFLGGLRRAKQKGYRFVIYRKPVHPRVLLKKAEDLLFPGKPYTA